MRWGNLLILVSLLGMAADAPPQEAQKKELQLFQGSWQPVWMQDGEGRLASEEELKSGHLLVQGHKLTLTGKNFTISGTFSVDPGKTPKTIDVILTTAEKTEVKFLGIYQIRDKIRKSCFALPGKERPKGFQTAVKGHLSFEWKRQP